MRRRGKPGYLSGFSGVEADFVNPETCPPPSDNLLAALKRKTGRRGFPLIDVSDRFEVEHGLLLTRAVSVVARMALTSKAVFAAWRTEANSNAMLVLQRQTVGGTVPVQLVLFCRGSRCFLPRGTPRNAVLAAAKSIVAQPVHPPISAREFGSQLATLKRMMEGLKVECAPLEVGVRAGLAVTSVRVRLSLCVDHVPVGN